MTDLLLTDAIILLVGIANLIGQWYFRSRPADIFKESKEAVKPTVTYTAPALTNENAATLENSAIVEPKSPQLVAWEEEQAVRKLNLKPR